MTGKAALAGVLGQSFAYCDKVLGAMTDQTGSEVVKFTHGNFARLAIVSLNIAHNFEHYGNLITYLRLKGMVPPSSQQPASPPTR